MIRIVVLSPRLDPARNQPLDKTAQAARHVGNDCTGIGAPIDGYRHIVMRGTAFNPGDVGIHRLQDGGSAGWDGRCRG